MIKTKISAVTGVTYGLLSALVIVVALAALTAAGVGVGNVFSLTGNTIAATMGAPNPIGSPNSNLNSEQQSEIANAAAEITTGTASAACLQQMNNPANAASMASNGATCLGPGSQYFIAPPASPVHYVANAVSMYGQMSAMEDSNGNVYSYHESGYASYGDVTFYNSAVLELNNNALQHWCGMNGFSDPFNGGNYPIGTGSSNSIGAYYECLWS